VNRKPERPAFSFRQVVLRRDESTKSGNNERFYEACEYTGATVLWLITIPAARTLRTQCMDLYTARLSFKRDLPGYADVRRITSAALSSIQRTNVHFSHWLSGIKALYKGLRNLLPHSRSGSSACDLLETIISLIISFTDLQLVHSMPVVQNSGNRPMQLRALYWRADSLKCSKRN
jgi:hypothetical protein